MPKKKECKVCSAGYVGYLMTEKLKNKEITYREFCDYFNITKAEAEEHVRSHKMNVQLPKCDNSDGESAIDYYNKFKMILKALEDWINVFIASGKRDKVTTQNMATLIKEYRQALMNLAELEGKIQRGQTVVQIQQYNQKLDELIDVIMNELCDRCRDKIVAKLEQLYHV